MNGIVVCKLSGSGNDFVFVDGRIAPVDTWTSEQIRALCDRRDGIGADGFGVLEPGSESNRIRFHFFNSDGGRAPMCGNGALCATRMARWSELAPDDKMVLETDAGLVRTQVLPDSGSLAEFELEEVGEIIRPDIALEPGELSISFTTVAVPHVVVVVEDPESIDVLERGEHLRHHKAFDPTGANVNFVSVSDDHVRVRTYERGVEGETMACATGSVACTAVLAVLGQSRIPQAVKTSSGRFLTVSGDLDENKHLLAPRLRGEARLVFRAVINQ